MWEYKPNIVQIEFVQGCNRACQFCGTVGMERRFHYMEKPTLVQIVRLIKESGIRTKILLAQHGEPTLHPNILEFITYIHRELPNTEIHLFTNGWGIRKDPTLIDRLFRAGLYALVCDEYHDSPLRRLVESNTSHEVVIAGDGVPLFSDRKGRILINPPIEFGSNGKKMNRHLCNHCGAGMPPLKEPVQKLCAKPFRELGFRWDGKVTLCCNDFRGEYFVCDAMGCHSLAQIWYHPRMESARRILMKKDRKGINVCRVCDAISSRVGLLPDKMGKMTLPDPTPEDYRVVNDNIPSLAVTVKREWE